LRVPSESIETCGGRNTKEEMQNLKKMLGADVNEKKWGLITSAWHLGRAERLAASEGLKFIPIPADFHSTDRPPTVLDAIPSADALADSARVTREWLAQWVNR
jgi:uncharacterized SAM-binding protein YcdF (DUF218 family)